MFEILLGFDAGVLTTFIVAGLILNVTPGSDFLFVTASAIAGGPKVGMAAAFGVNIGIMVHILASALGVSALLLAYPASYQAIKIAGAIYLAWLAIQMWRSDAQLGTGKAEITLLAAVKRGALTNVLNPKTALFIFAFIPQFTQPDNGPIWAQILVLGAVFQFFGLVFVMALGATAGTMGHVLRTRIRLLNRVSSFIFGGLAVRLIID